MSKHQMFAKVVLASKPTNGAPPIITMHLRYPRIIHGEIMTHRKKSRNARSSRAVPVATMLKEIREEPFIPWHWGKNQKGMQASEECNERVLTPTADEGMQGVTRHSRERAWREGAQFAANLAEQFSIVGYHKQIANRLIEPFSFIDTLVTSTSWANFFHLRDHKDAEPHFQDLARLMLVAKEEANFQELRPGQWHLPYVTEEDVAAVEDYLEPYSETTHPTMPYLQKLSVARCARISYKPFDGDGSIERELERYEQLVGSDPLHASPAEHQATPDSLSTYRRQVKIHEGPSEQHDLWKAVSEGNDWDYPELSGNLGPGWIQYRKTLKGEYVEDAA